MPEPVITITPEEAEAWLDGRSVRQEVSQHRWYTKYLIVFGDIGGHYGFYYLDPATEDQEGQDIFELDSEGHVPVFKLIGEEVCQIVWHLEGEHE